MWQYVLRLHYVEYIYETRVSKPQRAKTTRVRPGNVNTLEKLYLWFCFQSL